MIQQGINENSILSDSMSTCENQIYYTKMKTIPKVTVNLHGKLELSEEVKAVLNGKFGQDDCRPFLKE